jgi:hypothetical protein
MLTETAALFFDAKQSKVRAAGEAGCNNATIICLQSRSARRNAATSIGEAICAEQIFVPVARRVCIDTVDYSEFERWSVDNWRVIPTSGCRHAKARR